ncbi:MAG TPA: hypothetical protein PK787_06740, partial [Burkholderiaceae bacterium]|nr:hypothetical protein [Burkholderiaceae bacterium]
MSIVDGLGRKRRAARLRHPRATTVARRRRFAWIAIGSLRCAAPGAGHRGSCLAARRGSCRIASALLHEKQ